MKAMRRQLESLRNAFLRTTASDSALAEMELLDASIVSMSKLRCMQVRGVGTDNPHLPWELPSWTITRYEVDRFEMIGQGSFSRVYAGSWRDRVVAVKVLHDFTPASTFRREVELWRRLRHPQVVRMFGASSAYGSKPWFIVSELYERGSLVEWLLTAARDEYATPREVDQFRFISQIASGMEYLHAQGVVHGDLKCANVFVNREGNCAIADFGQSELKDDAYRLSGRQRPNGTPRWKAPEVLDGAASPTMQADIYAFAICCAEILNMGGIPYGTRDDEDVKRIVLEHDARPEVSDTPLSTIVLPVITCCWARDPRNRSPFSMTVFWLRGCRNLLHPYGADGLPAPCTPSGPMNSPVIGFSDRSSPSLRVFGTPASEGHSWLAHISSMSDYYSTSSGFGSEFGHSEPDLESPDVPESSMSSGTSGADPNAVGEASTENTMDGAILEMMSMSTWARAMQNERRYRLLAKDTHGYGALFTTPLWYPSPVEVGAVGYISKPDGEFITLCNVMEIGGKKKAEGDLAKCMTSLRDYGSINIGKANRVHKNSSSILSRFKIGGNRHDGENVSRRQAFPLEAGKKTAGVYAESFEVRDFSHGSLSAVSQWFKDNIHMILQEYAPNHPIQKEDVFLVTGTVNARDYALFVADPISSGEAHFNVFSSRRANYPWGTFTVKFDGKDYFPALTNFTSKVSRTHKTWDTILLARLRFAPDAEEPTLN
jgi:serine/threonine protein kinase